MRCCHFIFATAILFSPAAAWADEDLEITFNDHCRECHSFLKNDNRLGPSLYGVVGRKAGAEPGYGYTQSLKDSGSPGTSRRSTSGSPIPAR